MKNEQSIGSYEISKFPKVRIPTLDFLAVSDKNHYVKSLIEVDVTTGRRYLINQEKKSGVKLSFTAWLLKCIAKAASEHKSVHSMMKGKNKIIKFDDVDISIVVEKSIRGVKAPVPLVIRKTNEKNLLQIHDEIRTAQKEEINEPSVLGVNPLKGKIRLYTSMPKFIRRFLIKRIIKNPIKAKQIMGTIVVTAVGMFGKVYGWPIPTTSHPLAIAIGGITKKPGVNLGEIEIREYLTITILFNHDVVDGAPATRFISQLVELIESGFGLQS
ncbi:MAG: 2-oxo acid dehydrogenase subunit E2 [Promethearchaeota archaeon]|jgi:pyruvate/2-oxoglutarate dehydrogenase complex dihydrolipoamide acyltransferase (E2) component